MKTVWLVGRHLAVDDDWNWDVLGIFTTEESAVAICRTDDHFVAPVELDVPFGDEVREFPGAWYPLSEAKS